MPSIEYVYNNAAQGDAAKPRAWPYTLGGYLGVLYLIGTDHSVQHDGRAAYHGAEFEKLRREFPEFLAQAVRETGAKMIAEECNEEVLLKFSATRSVAAVVASEMNLSHLFCEPSLAERAWLGITGTGNPSDFEKREEYWLKQLCAVDKTPIIFIVGADHVHSFSGLAKTSGMGVEIVDDYYGRGYFAPPKNV